jgi:hypothetical protein
VPDNNPTISRLKLIAKTPPVRSSLSRKRASENPAFSFLFGINKEIDFLVKSGWIAEFTALNVPMSTFCPFESFVI